MTNFILSKKVTKFEKSLLILLDISLLKFRVFLKFFMAESENMNFKSSEQPGNSDQFCSDQKVKKKLGRIQDE